MSKKEHILAFIFSFTLSFFLFLLLLIGTSKFSLMNQNYILNVLDHVNYYEGITKELNVDLANGAGAAGFHPDIYKDFIKSKDVRALSINYIKNYFENGNAEIDSNSFKVELNTYLHDVAKKEKIDLTQEDESRLKEYIEINASAYVQYLSFPFIQYFIMGFDILNGVIPFLLITCLIIIVLSLFFLKRLQLKSKNYVFYLTSSFAGTALMLSIIPVFILVNGFIQRINLTPECYYQFVVQYIQIFLYILIIIAFILICIATFLYLFNKRRIMRYQEINKV